MSLTPKLFIYALPVTALGAVTSLLVPFQDLISYFPRSASLYAQVSPNESREVRSYQSGSVLYLDNGTVRVGVDGSLGGAISEFSFQGVNFINSHDAGREVQLSFYDRNHRYDACAGCTGQWGWNPVQGGDLYGHGSPILEYKLAEDFIYTKTQPYEWFPSDKGGNPYLPVLSDVLIEQWISFASSNSNALKVKYKVTHLGQDVHAYGEQEFPAVFVNSQFNKYIAYEGSAPWAKNDPLSRELPKLSETEKWVEPRFHLTEMWASLVDGSGFGLTIFRPSTNTYVMTYRTEGDGGPEGYATNYMALLKHETFEPGTVVEEEVYLLGGNYKDARQEIYNIKNNLIIHNKPVVRIDTPRLSEEIKGDYLVTGWALDDLGIKQVNVSLDNTFIGKANLGKRRFDIQKIYFSKTSDIGWDYKLDTKKYSNGPHKLKLEFITWKGKPVNIERYIYINNDF